MSSMAYRVLAAATRRSRASTWRRRGVNLINNLVRGRADHGHGIAVPIRHVQERLRLIQIILFGCSPTMILLVIVGGVWLRARTTISRSRSLVTYTLLSPLRATQNGYAPPGTPC